jgi:uncharacterized protein (TIGR02145 family)
MKYRHDVFTGIICLLGTVAFSGCGNYILLPSVQTHEVTEIGTDMATGGGEVTDDAGYEITERGICWSTGQNPTILDSYTNDGSGTGVFTSSITGLIPETPYYVRAYATNANGTAYGSQVAFTTLKEAVYGLPCAEVPTVSYGGQVYNTVKIGNQCWMRENLNIGVMINGSLNQSNNQTIEKFCYQDNNTNCLIYGGLYQWDEVMQYSTAAGVQGICPQGWHVPTDQEWNTLAEYLGGWEDAGGKVKETGTTHWMADNFGATNQSGFTGLPGGFRQSDGSFGYLKENGYFWTSTTYDQENAWDRFISYYNTNLTRYNYGYKKAAMSVRCILN